MNIIIRFYEKDKKLFVKVTAGLILLVIAFAFYYAKEKRADQDVLLSEIPGTEIQQAMPTSEAAIEDNAIIIVDISGAVVNPRVIELPSGSRVYEAIEKAGGLTKTADTRTINQAEKLMDGQKLYIPTKEELENGQSGASLPTYNTFSTGNKSNLININTADSAGLQELSGVGPATAEKIINYRSENGKFNSIEDIKNVSGIGDKTFEKFKDKITI